MEYFPSVAGRAGLSRGCEATLNWISRLSINERGHCYAGTFSLAYYLNVTERTIRRHRAELLNRGLLERVPGGFRPVLEVKMSAPPADKMSAPPALQNRPDLRTKSASFEAQNVRPMSAKCPPPYKERLLDTITTREITTRLRSKPAREAAKQTQSSLILVQNGMREDRAAEMRDVPPAKVAKAVAESLLPGRKPIENRQAWIYTALRDGWQFAERSAMSDRLEQQVRLQRAAMEAERAEHVPLSRDEIRQRMGNPAWLR